MRSWFRSRPDVATVIAERDSLREDVARLRREIAEMRKDGAIKRAVIEALNDCNREMHERMEAGRGGAR